MTAAPGRLGVAVAAFALTGTVLGRAGGGGHSADGGAGHAAHSGGAHSTGGGDSSAGGLIAALLLALLVWYLIRRFKRVAPAVADAGAAPVLRETIGAVLGAAVGAADGAAARAAWGVMSPRPVLPAAVAAIRALDPAFEMENFLQRVELTFFLVKRGLQMNDAGAIRPYLDDALFAQVAGNIDRMKAQHRHDLLESLNVRALHLVDAACDERAQRLQVHFDLVYRAKTLDDANRVVADEGGDRRHGERWTLQRAAAARTPVSGGVVASRCPACGAELRLGLDGICAHCRASVTNGTVDWIVTDVQAAPFEGYRSDASIAVGAPTFMEGMASLRAADPAFSLEAFRARVRTAFLALQDAWCRQDLEAGRAFLSPGAYFSWRAQLDTLKAEGRRNVMENLEVRSIDPTAIVHGRVFDDLTVRVVAACADFEVDAAGIVFGDRVSRPFTEEWTFQRSVGSATSTQPGTLENTCPRCGAPLALTQIGECRYCKAAVTSGKFDWVVSRIEQESDAVDGDCRPGGDLAMQLGSVVVGGLLGSLLAGRSSDE